MASARFPGGQTVKRIHHKQEHLYKPGLLLDSIQHLLADAWTSKNDVPDIWY
jgi:hypothetical protein